MLKFFSRAKAADAIQNLYSDAYWTGYTILDAACWAEHLARHHTAQRPSIINRTALAALTATRFTVHTGLFLIWAPATLANTTAQRLLNAGQQA